jgi:uncharacterized protein HemX
MNAKLLAVLSVALLLLGLGLGYLMWGRGTTELRNELGRANDRLAEQSVRADEMQSKFTETESELRRAAEGLRRERELRERFEELVSEGRK